MQWIYLYLLTVNTALPQNGCMASAAMSTARGALHGITNNDAYQAGRHLGDAGIDRVIDEVTADDPEAEAEGFQVVDETGHVIKTTTAEEYDADGFAQADIMGVVRVIGGAMIGIGVLVIVLNEIFSLSQIENSSGPFADVISSLETTGVAALSLLVIGLLVAAANRVMGFFGGGGF